ncbi:MAG: SprB repeat-containing protein, partial [Bacteroidota bacterium]
MILVNPTVTTTYTVTVTDNIGCEDVQSVEVFIYPNPVVTITGDTEVCPGETTTLMADGGQIYIWSTGFRGATISNLPPGDYSVQVFSSDGCETVEEVTITELPGIIASGNVTDVECNGGNSGAISLDISGGTPPFEVTWVPNVGSGSQIGSLSAGTYTATIMDDAGCTITREYVVDEATELAIDPPVVTDVSCNGAADGRIDLTVTGGTPPYTYAWADGATGEGRRDLSGGTYPVTVTDDNGCTDEITVTVNEASTITVVATITDVACNGEATGAISVDISGGTPPYDVRWAQTGETTTTITGLTATSYSLSVLDGAGCTFGMRYFVGEAPALVIETPVVVDVSCNGAADGSINLTVTGGTPPYTYAWEDGATTEDRSSLVGGTYPVTVTDDNG